MLKTLSLFILFSVCFLVACGAQPLVTNIDLQPSIISPNEDGKDDVAEVKYTLTASADITITLIAANGKEYALRRNQRRTAGDYQFLFGGVVDGRVMPDGAYTFRF